MDKFYSNDNVLVTDIKLDNHALDLKSASEFHEFFEICRVVQWIVENNFKRTALQLPDGFLQHAYQLSSTIEAECVEVNIYILADTSYRNCCVDDVAAQHANCDSLVHFGESCLSKTTERIPVLYVFGKFPLSIKNFSRRFDEFVEAAADLTDTTIFLVYDAVFSHLKEELNECIRNSSGSATNVVSCDLASTSQTTDVDVVLGRIVPKHLLNEAQQTSKTLLVFVGSRDSKLLPLWLMTFPLFNNYIHYVPEIDEFTHEIPESNRLLRKRLFLVEKLRDANVIGLVIGTLEIKGYKEAIQRVRQLCKAASKKLYVLSIGKLNEAKLSNFVNDIDAFIMLSCPFGIVLDTSEFYKPIVSMFEAEIALNSSKEWFASAGWTSEFSNILQDEIKAGETDNVDVSLITGKIRATHIVEDDSDTKNRQMAVYSAGDYFNNRSWKGLDDGYHQDDSLEVKEGLTGIAREYSSESR